MDKKLSKIITDLVKIKNSISASEGVWEYIQSAIIELEYAQSANIDKGQYGLGERQMNIDKQKLYNFLFMYQETFKDSLLYRSSMDIKFTKDELDYVIDLVANDMHKEPYINTLDQDRELSPELIKKCIEKTKPLFTMKTMVTMTKEEAIEFAKKYLQVRKRKRDGGCPNDEPYWIWRCAIDYVVNDIIPYIYGDALD